MNSYPTTGHPLYNLSYTTMWVGRRDTLQMDKKIIQTYNEKLKNLVGS